MNGLLGYLRDLHIKHLEACMHDLNVEEGISPGSGAHQRKKTLTFKLGKLAPGSTACIAAVESSDGEVATSTEDIARILANHWGGVFSAKPVDFVNLDGWLADDRPSWFSGIPPFEVCIERKHATQAIKYAKNTSPGPDGIPYAAYAAGDVTEAIIEEATRALTEEDPTEPTDLNHAFLSCLPKKPERHANGLDIFKPKGTRPLSIGNTDNRLVSAVLRISVFDFLAAWISIIQRGFITGRSMLENVLEIDLRMRLLALQEVRALVVFFDFEAAFPSIAHPFIWRILKEIGVPRCFIRALRKLYHNNIQTVRFSGNTSYSFPANSGIKQGCPISPIVFALAIDVLLRRLAYRIPRSLNRAFADDIGSAFICLQDAVIAFTIFEEFAGFSGLCINMGKTVIIPLWATTTAEARRFIHDNFPALTRAQVALLAKYLGIWLGPMAEDQQWVDPAKKYASRIEQWARPEMGLQLCTRAYNTYAASVLQFVSQFSRIPEAVIKLETYALRRFASGPGNWIQQRELFHLRSH